MSFPCVTSTQLESFLDSQAQQEREEQAIYKLTERYTQQLLEQERVEIGSTTVNLEEVICEIQEIEKSSEIFRLFAVAKNYADLKMANKLYRALLECTAQNMVGKIVENSMDEIRAFAQGEH
ncbi:hypothetical protein [Algicola sagamiensis]|uniref:hypothetical protein n=1 Tax=Algicola sagamiensis TaxID=163869 RepID=UPI000360759B|nr:hypothetical protein [Algicola sagamiensis]